MFSMNPLANILSNATRKRRVLGEPEDPYNINPDSIDFSGAQPLQQQGGGHPVLANILQAIATGAGIGFSQDPSQALMQTLAQQRQQAMKQAEIAADERRQQQQIDSQQKLEGMRIKAQKDIVGTEETGRNTRQKEEISARQEEKKTGFANDLEMQKAQEGTQLKIQSLTQNFQAGEAQKNQKFQIELQKARDAGDIQQVEAKTVMAALLHAKANSRYLKGAEIPMGTIVSIADKLGKGQPLTKEETTAVDAAYKVQEAVNKAMLRGGGGGGGLGGVSGLNIKNQGKIDVSNITDWNKNRNDLVNGVLLKATEPLKDATGNVVRDSNGKPQYTMASGEELSNRVREVIDLHDSINPDPRLPKPKPEPRPGTITDTDLIISGQIDDLKRNGTPDKEILKIIDNSKEMNEAQKRQARAKLTPNRFSSKVFGK